MIRDQWLPNFLGIGGTRCGSTWLHYNLIKHPNLWLPPKKELHYFDRSTDYESPSYLATERLWDRLWDRGLHNQHWRRRAFRELARCLTRQTSTLPWKLKYYLGRYNDTWYASLFKSGRDKLRGEITPAYSILSPRDIARVHSLMPRAKIILFLRYPIDRIWSGFRKNFITEGQIRERLALPHLDPRSDYVTILSNWRQLYPQEQLHVEFFDDIETDPESLLRRVYDFLGVDSSEKYIWPELREKHNASPPKPMPQDLELALTKKYVAMLEELSQILGSHATTWLERAQTTLGKHGRASEAA